MSQRLLALESFPSAPEIACAVLVEAGREDFSARRLAALVTRDQALAATLLRVANTTFFTTTRVTSIDHAITLVGFARVRQFALALSVWTTFEGWVGKARQFRPVLWQHATAVGAVAKLLAERVQLDGADAFTAGLLHDIGKLALGFRLGDSYWDLLQQAERRGLTAATIEQDTFGINHAGVAEWLFQLWNFPSVLVAPVAAHHHPLTSPTQPDLCCVVAIADRLVSGTDLATGIIRSDIAEELSAVVPELFTPDDWSSGRFVHAQRAIMTILDAPPRMRRAG